MTRPAYTTDPLSRPAQTVWQAERRRGPIAPAYSHRIHAALANPLVPASERRSGWIATGCVAVLPVLYIIGSIWS